MVFDGEDAPVPGSPAKPNKHFDQAEPSSISQARPVKSNALPEPALLLPSSQPVQIVIEPRTESVAPMLAVPVRQEASQSHNTTITPPLYFTRSKRKRTDSSAQEHERLLKIAKAMLAQVGIDTWYHAPDFMEAGEVAFPATETHGIRIPQTYQEAVNDLQHGQEWTEAIAEELVSLKANGTWEEVIPPKGSDTVSCK